MCATFNVTQSAMTIIKEELEQGGAISDLIMMRKKPWKELFVKHTFFTHDFKYYLSVTTCSMTKEAHKKWSGYVESKVRLLVQGLERHPSIALARPFNKGYERVHLCKNEAEIEAVQNGALQYVMKEKPAIVETKIKMEDQILMSDANKDGERANQQDLDKDQVMQDAVKEESQTNQQVKEEGTGRVSLQDIPAVSQNEGHQKHIAMDGDANHAPVKNGDVKTEDVMTKGTTNGVVKTEDAKRNGMEVYTTSHYIGLVLAEGEFPPACLLVKLLFFAFCCPPRFR
jgi:poly(A) polymerase